MNVAGGPAESPWPKNVGLLFFNEEPQRFFPGVQIDVVWFPEGAGGDRFEEKIFKGPLARMTREALSYIQRNYLHETVIKHPDRAEATRVWNFPYAAIEEARSITDPTRSANPSRCASATTNWSLSASPARIVPFGWKTFRQVVRSTAATATG